MLSKAISSSRLILSILLITAVSSETVCNYTGSEFKFSQTSAGNQAYPALTNIGESRFVALWSSDKFDDSGLAIVGTLYELDRDQLAPLKIVSEFMVRLVGG